MEMLELLIEDGRSILLFSQFTSMLDIIKAQLAKSQIPFVEITGDTKDRETPVSRFQNGEVSLFLISLKAGSTGGRLQARETADRRLARKVCACCWSRWRNSARFTS